MAGLKRKYKLAPFFWRQLLWKLAIILLILLLLGEVGYIWWLGAGETKDAFASGRRLLISLDSGAIEGKIISSTGEEKKPEAESKKLDPLPVTEVKEVPVSTEENPAPVAEKTAPVAEPEIVNTLDTIKEEKEIDLPAIAPSANPPPEFSANLSEKTEYGTLPKIDSSGIKPWKYYSKPVTLQDKKPMIAIIITGLGQNRNIGEQAVRLPEAVNLSFSPYSKDLNSWMVSARLSGHEVLLDLPMEAANYPISDPGPLGLLVSKDQAENEIKIKKLMAQNAGYVGFLTPLDEAFLENNELFKSLSQILAGRGLMMVVGKPPPKNETRDMIEKGNTASAIIDNVIDEELTPTAIAARLSLLEQTAKQRGYAVGVAHPYPITIKQINEWAAKAQANGFELVPVSMIVSKHY